MKHILPALPYAPGALAPLMSEETIQYHYGKHLQTYIDNLNGLIAGTEYEDMTLEEIVRKSSGAIFNNAAQVWNHTFFFMTLSPSPVALRERFSKMINENFGSLENLKAELKKAAVGLFGSGWAWLCETEDGKLVITQESNAGNPMTKGLKPLLTIDVWEHAYYIDYRNRRPDYFEAVWQMIDWTAVYHRL